MMLDGKWWARRLAVRPKIADMDHKGSPPLLWDDPEIGLLWSPKAACTASVMWFFMVTGHFGKAESYHPWPHRYRMEVFQKSDAFQRLYAGRRPSDVFFVRVIRDPYMRTVSMYRHALRKPFAYETLSAFLGRPVDRENGFSFDEFLDYLESADPDQLDPHFREQKQEIEEHLDNWTVINADREPLGSALEAVEVARGLPRTGISGILETSGVLQRHTAQPTGVVEYATERIMSKADADRHWPEPQSFLTGASEGRIRALFETDLAWYAPYL